MVLYFSDKNISKTDLMALSNSAYHNYSENCFEKKYQKIVTFSDIKSKRKNKLRFISSRVLVPTTESYAEHDRSAGDNIRHCYSRGKIRHIASCGIKINIRIETVHHIQK